MSTVTSKPESPLEDAASIPNSTTIRLVRRSNGQRYWIEAIVTDEAADHLEVLTRHLFTKLTEAAEKGAKQ